MKCKIFNAAVFKSGFLRVLAWSGMGLLVSLLFFRFCFEKLQVPSSSMNGTIKPGETVWVNKLIPGLRLIANNPGRYRRLVLWRDLRHDDLVVFNSPDADTIIDSMPGISYRLLRVTKPGVDSLLSLDYGGNIVALEVTRRPRMVKRVVGLPGETIEIVNGELFVNGNLTCEGLNVIHSFQWVGEAENLARVLRRSGVDSKPYTRGELLLVNLSGQDIKKIGEQASNLVKSTLLPGIPDPFITRSRGDLNWNSDNLGKLYLPKAGDQIELNERNYYLYSHLLRAFEQVEIRRDGDNFYLNDARASYYTFMLDYYWVHGDNKPVSFDSRFWGPLPGNHIVGIVVR